METLELLTTWRNNQKKGRELEEELRKRQEEIKARLYLDLVEAYACGIRFRDGDRVFKSPEIWPLKPLYDNNESVLVFTHKRESTAGLVDLKDFPE